MSKGTESSFQPSETKKKRNYKIIIPTFLIIQAVGYIVSGIVGFRYFGYHWNPVLSYIMASFFVISSMLFIWKPNQSSTGLKLLLVVDLIFSLIQFFLFQMWFAFNWNIFVVAVEFFIIANIPRKKINSNFVINKLRRTAQNTRKIVITTSQRIDTKLTDLNVIHLFLVVQASILLISNLILGSSFWLVWTIFGLNILVIFCSVFSRSITMFSILLQPIIWIGLCFAWEPIGWKIIHATVSLVFTINYIQKQLNKQKENGFLRRVSSFLSFPINSSVALLSISFIAFIPMWNIFWIAFSPSNTVVPTNFFPSNPTLNNFVLLFTQENILLYFGNSLLVSIGSATLCILLTVLAAYAFSRYKFKVKKQLMVGVFIMKMFTGILTLIPFYLIMFNLGLIDNYIGVILAYSTQTIPLGLWIIKGYMDSIPKELDESALLMGNSTLRVLRKVVLPLAAPAIAVAFLLNFLTAWNGFLLAFVLLQSPLRYTLPIKLYTFLGSLETSSPEWGMFAAASLLVMIPMILMFIFLRNYLLKGTNYHVHGGDI
jgi:arabinogalactan oligomer/maltooligosaccharide transport system permease protein